MNEWINVNDDLPLIKFPVLIWTANGCSAGYYDEIWYTIFNDVIDDVLYWRPFPFGPNGEGVVSRTLIKKIK